MTITKTSEFRKALQNELLNLQRYARTFYKDQASADDLVQDTLIRAMEKCHLYKEDVNLRAWLYRMMHNIFCNQHKKLHRYQHVDADKVLPVMPDEGNQEDSVRLMQVQAAFDQLQENHRAVLYLVTVEGLSYQEAADTLGVKVGTIKSRISRARNELLDLMQSTPYTQADNPDRPAKYDLRNYLTA